jgi:hypothetical protein
METPDDEKLKGYDPTTGNELAKPEPEGPYSLKFQERSPFGDFLARIDNGVRPEATPEDQERMDSNLVQLGKIFEGSNTNWHIDGALNISIRKGTYLGVHKDVDVAIEKADLPTMQQQLEANGYGLFFSYPKNPDEPEGANIMERVSAEKFAEGASDHLSIAAIDGNGKIRTGASLNFIDVHLVKRNEQGKPLDWGDVELPEEWFIAQPTQFKGQELHLSHPAKVAYYKLHATRDYDRTDLKAFAETGALTVDDVDTIGSVIEKENDVRRASVESLLQRVTEGMKLGMSTSEIVDAFVREPLVQASLEQVRPQVEAVSEKIAQSDMSFETITNLTYEAFGIRAALQERKDRVAELRGWVEGK